MTAAIATKAGLHRAGLRAYDASRDMAALADLIAVSFADRLDEPGRRLIRSMALLGRAGRIGAMLGRWVLPPAAYPYGFVWEQGGRVIGNASVLPVEGFSQRWVMANVAVLPAFRRGGIAKALVESCIDLVRREGGKTIILQVDSDNHAGLCLYESLGFRVLSARRTWWGRVDGFVLPASHDERVRRREPQTWREQWALAKRIFPEGLIWPYPTSSAFFRPSALEQLAIGDMNRHWVWRDQGLLLGSLSIRRGSAPGIWRLILIVDPRAHGQAEAPLLARGLREGPAQRGECVLDYPSGLAEDTLRKMGWTPRRDLIWMGFDL